MSTGVNHTSLNVGGHSNFDCVQKYRRVPIPEFLNSHGTRWGRLLSVAYRIPDLLVGMLMGRSYKRACDRLRVRKGGMPPRKIKKYFEMEQESQGDRTLK